MSYDLTIWKPSPEAGKASTEDVLAAIERDEGHPAIQRFDAKAFLHDLQGAFGGEEQWADDADPPFLFDVADFTGVPANWIGVSGFRDVPSELPRLLKVAKDHGLSVFDWQTGKTYSPTKRKLRWRFW